MLATLRLRVGAGPAPVRRASGPPSPVWGGLPEPNPASIVPRPFS